MTKPGKTRKDRSPARAASSPGQTWTSEAQELRALLRRVPDGLKATLQSLAVKPDPDRERVMLELARGLGREILPLFRTAALDANEPLSCTAIRLLPAFGTRAAADVLAEVQAAVSGEPRQQAVRDAAKAFRARSIQVSVSEPEAPRSARPRLIVREAAVSMPDGVGSRSVAVRLQDVHGVWHALLVIWNDRAGVKDGFLRPLSRKEWEDLQARPDVSRGPRYLSCEPDYVRWMIQRARELNAVTGFPLGMSLVDWDELVGPVSTDYIPPDPCAAQRSDPELHGRSLEQGARLYDELELRSWFLEAADCVNWAERWLVLQLAHRNRSTPEDSEKKIRELVALAVDDRVDQEHAKLYRERMTELARGWEWLGRPRPAGLAAAVALALEQGIRPAEIPFFPALMERTLFAVSEMLRSGQDIERTRYRPLRRYQT
jgi:hypothetical protein